MERKLKPEYNDEKLWKVPLSVYYAVISNKLVHGVKLRSNFKDYFPKESNEPKTKFLKSVTAAVSEMAKTAEKYGPGMRTGCQLTCQKVSSGSEVIIYSSQNTSRVIQSILLRLYDIKKERVAISENWRKMLITMTWDGSDSQVKEIPLAGLFITGLDFLREIKSLNNGLRKVNCELQGYRGSEMTQDDWLAYLFYEMPFRKSARISVKIPAGFESAIICSKFLTKKLDVNKYHPRLTGYFSGQLQQQGFDIFQHKTILHLENQWGHVVELNFFLRNAMIGTTHELDVIIETGDANVPVISGTGLEEIFHYVHDFRESRNLTSLFDGVPFYLRKGNYRILRCYRHMTIDPILFTTGIRIYLESYPDRTVKPALRKFFPSTSSFSQTILPDSLFTVILFYGSKGTGGKVTDKVEYQDLKHSSSRSMSFKPSSVNIFHVRSMFENQSSIFLTEQLSP